MTEPAARSVKVFPAASWGGRGRVPGDKSISHRVAMLAGLARGKSVVRGFLRAADCLSTAAAMAGLGARCVWRDDGLLEMEGCGGHLREPGHVLDVGNSGTTMRLLPGLLAGHSFAVELTGDASLRSRPMSRIKKPLEEMGARVDLLGENGCAPLRVQGGDLHAISYELPMASAQVKSCVLLAGLYARGTTTVTEPRLTRDHTERLLRACGIPVRTEGNRVSMVGYGSAGPRIEGREWVVPGDFSSAAFHLLAAGARPGARLELEGVGLNPRRTAFLDVLRRMGAGIEVEPAASPDETEPRGIIRVTGGRLRGVEVGGDEIPNLIDELPLVAAAGALAEGVTVIRDAAELRVKESDRIASMANNLRQLGVSVEERPDGMVVEGASELRASGALPSYGDHRVAMTMAVLGLFAREPVEIEDVACVETSYTGFWDAMRSFGAHVEE